ncbi:MAG: hypothetical protein U0745_14270 [Polyangia bacterium]
MQEQLHLPDSAPTVSSQGVLSALQRGLSKVQSTPLLVIGLTLTSLFASLCATLPARAVLRDALGNRPLAEKLARGEYDVGFIEVLSDNPAGVAAVSSVLLIALLCFFLLQSLIAGGIVSRLSPSTASRAVPPGQFLVRCAESAVSMLKLELLFGLAVRTPLLLLVAAAAGMSVGWSKAAELAWPTIVLRVAPVFLTFATLWSVGSIWQTLARMKRLDDETLSAWQSLRAGFSLLVHRRVILGALLLAVLSVIAHLGLLITGRSLVTTLDAKQLVLWAFLLRQGFSLLKTAVSMLLIAATCELADES